MVEAAAYEFADTAKYVETGEADPGLFLENECKPLSGYAAGLPPAVKLRCFLAHAVSLLPAAEAICGPYEWGVYDLVRC